MSIGNTHEGNDWLAALEHGEEIWQKLEARLKVLLNEKISNLDTSELMRRVDDQGFWNWLWAMIKQAAQVAVQALISFLNTALELLLKEPNGHPFAA